MWHLVTRKSYLNFITIFQVQPSLKTQTRQGSGKEKCFGKKYRIWKAHSTISLYLYNVLLLIELCTFLLRSMYTVTPGSEQIRATIERDGIVSYYNVDILYFQLIIPVERPYNKITVCIIVGLSKLMS